MITSMREAVDRDPTEDAVRWLRRSYRAGALVDALAAAGMAVPGLYGPTLRFGREFRRDRPEFSYALRTGAPLMAGWTVLLLWPIASRSSAAACSRSPSYRSSPG